MLCLGHILLHSYSFFQSHEQSVGAWLCGTSTNIILFEYLGVYPIAYLILMYLYPIFMYIKSTISLDSRKNNELDTSKVYI